MKLVTVAILSVLSIALLPRAGAFSTPCPSAKKTRRAVQSSLSAFPTDILSDVFSSDETLSPVVEAARQKFWFYFFAGSGAGGIGIAQLPSLFKEAGVARASAGSGTTNGGAALNAGPLVGLYYDSEISAEDVKVAIAKAPTADFISGRSQSINYMASKGYIEKSDFIREMGEKGCNPLASYALYDAISSGKGGIVSPVVYEDTLTVYREGSSSGDVPSSFTGDLNGFLAVKVAAFLGLVFCLLVDAFFVGNAWLQGFA